MFQFFNAFSVVLFNWSDPVNSIGMFSFAAKLPAVNASIELYPFTRITSVLFEELRLISSPSFTAVSNLSAPATLCCLIPSCCNCLATSSLIDSSPPAMIICYGLSLLIS